MHVAHDCHLVLNLLHVESSLQNSYINLEKKKKKHSTPKKQNTANQRRFLLAIF